MVRSRRLLLTAQILLTVCAASGGMAQTETKLAPESLGVGDFFGRAVAISSDGRYAVVGAPEEVDADTTDGGMEAGKAYVFERTGEGWLERAVLRASDPDSLSLFGRAVALSNDATRIFVGAPYAGLGAAYVFVRDGEEWREESKLELIDGAGPPSGDRLLDRSRFGKALAASATGDVVVVAAQDDRVPGFTNGSLNVFRRSAQGWEPVTKLVVTEGRYFGTAVALSADGRRAFAGTYACCGSGETGRVYVFDESDGAWEGTAVLTGSDAEPANRFGTELAVTPDGDWLLVGADGADDIGSSSGAAYVFERTGVGWAERQRLTASDAADQDFFGSSVALTADAGTLVIGALGHDAGALDSGAAYVFVRNGSAWEEQAVIAPSDPGERHFFGTSVALTPSGKHALFGVWAANARANSSGAAYVYDLSAVLPIEGAAESFPTVRLSVHPNPSAGHATLLVSLPQPGLVEVVLLDVLGRVVRSVWDGPSSGGRVLNVNASGLPNGVYFVRAATRHGVTVEPFTLQR